jgi:hypothetical protein
MLSRVFRIELHFGLFAAEADDENLGCTTVQRFESCRCAPKLKLPKFIWAKTDCPFGSAGTNGSAGMRFFGIRADLVRDKNTCQRCTWNKEAKISMRKL